MATYRITTWDADLEEYTPQDGVPARVSGIGELRAAMRALQANGYSCNRNRHDSDPSVLIERED